MPGAPWEICSTRILRWRPKDNLYRCLDKLVAHKAALFSFLQERWKDLFGIRYEVLLYDLTSTYFESNPPFAEGDKRQFWLQPRQAFRLRAGGHCAGGHPRGLSDGLRGVVGQHQRQDDAQDFLERIQKQYGKARRVWVMGPGHTDR